jgi:hypothetical protein
MVRTTSDQLAADEIPATGKRPWVTPAIVRSSASQTEKAGGDYDSNYETPGFLS